jgi:hypothetical protein
MNHLANDFGFDSDQVAYLYSRNIGAITDSAYIFRANPRLRPSHERLGVSGVEVHFFLAKEDASPGTFVDSFDAVLRECGVKGPFEHELRRY